MDEIALKTCKCQKIVVPLQSQRFTAPMSIPHDIDNPYIPGFEEYIRQGEPDKKAKASLWQTAIGLQAVDGLQTSDYLHETARRNIEGEIDLEEANKLIHSYYKSRSAHDEPIDDDEAEADRAAANIARILSSQTLAFSANGLIALHRRIFEGVFSHAGQIRKFDITKKEFVLRGDTVNYLNCEDIRNAIEYDIKEEKAFSYAHLSNDELIAHITHFTYNLWQIHPFQEGNTRTTAVFLIQYLRSIGFEVDNDLFASHAWYFRNALVRAVYANARLHIDYSPQYLERFFRNLLLGEQWELKSRYLVINPPAEYAEQPRKDTPTSTPTSTPASLPETIERVIRALGDKQLTGKELMSAVGLKDRKNFVEYSLNPAIENGYVRLLYPNSPHHPRQKYLLTVKGMMAMN